METKELKEQHSFFFKEREKLLLEPQTYKRDFEIKELNKKINDLGYQLKQLSSSGYKRIKKYNPTTIMDWVIKTKSLDILIEKLNELKSQELKCFLINNLNRFASHSKLILKSKGNIEVKLSLLVASYKYNLFLLSQSIYYIKQKRIFGFYTSMFKALFNENKRKIIK